MVRSGSSFLKGALWMIFILAFIQSWLNYEKVYLFYFHLPHSVGVCLMHEIFPKKLTFLLLHIQQCTIKLLHSQTSTMIFYCYLPYVQHKKKCLWLKEIRVFILFCLLVLLFICLYVYVSQCIYTQPCFFFADKYTYIHWIDMWELEKLKCIYNRYIKY